MAEAARVIDETRRDLKVALSSEASRAGSPDDGDLRGRGCGAEAPVAPAGIGRRSLHGCGPRSSRGTCATHVPRPWSWTWRRSVSILRSATRTSIPRSATLLCRLLSATGSRTSPSSSGHTRSSSNRASCDTWCLRTASSRISRGCTIRSAGMKGSTRCREAAGSGDWRGFDSTSSRGSGVLVGPTRSRDPNSGTLDVQRPFAARGLADEP